jgi:type I pantothenate kinase
VLIPGTLAIVFATPSPFVDLDREQWSLLSASTPLPLTAEDVACLRGLGDPINLDEVDTIYRPLSRLLNLYARATTALNDATTMFLGQLTERTPFVLGITGSVAVGKTTTARLLRELMARWPETPRVELVTTDGFLYPNAELERRGIMHRKGFPESYNWPALLSFVKQVKSGAAEVEVPLYDHVTYDILPETRTIQRPDMLIVEGVNVLQPADLTPDGDGALAVSDFFDFSIYVDADVNDVRRWFIDRFQRLRSTAFADPRSFFRQFADLSDEEALEIASQVWETINLPNLVDNIQPTRGRATLVLRKGPDHLIERIRLRKV